MFELSVIIVNYNVKYFLEQCLLSVRKASRGLAAEVIVVDNNSVDDSAAMVREKFPEARLIVNERNVGFAAANNQAIANARGEYVLLLNPDTVVEEDCFSKCLVFMAAHPDAGALGVRMIDGAGKYLPESKRGFPSPWAAFCKTAGLSRLFPRSRLFNGYHLGYLDERQTQAVEVLSGAFMLLRRSALERVGLLDEAFFMYGEDIDLSYRLLLEGYRNYYFPHTTIIHYKGESAKKGSLNYVRVFYQAMIIFARKHFRGRRAGLLVFMLQTAIYLRAAVALLSAWSRRLAWPLLDAGLIFFGLLGLKDFWAVYHFGDPSYYPASFLYVNAPLYTAIWLLSIYFSGAYDAPDDLRRQVRGILAGTVLLAAVYGFLDLEYRTSRAIIALGAGWALLSTTAARFAWHLWRRGNLHFGRDRLKNLVVVGSERESERVRLLLMHAGARKNFIGAVAPQAAGEGGTFLGGLSQLEEIAHIYKVDEVIFCSRDVSAQAIMHWMSRLGPAIEYKIMPEESLSIIGSSSRDAPGELYTIDIRFNIAQPLQRRNKRLLDIALALACLFAFPLFLALVARPAQALRNALAVLLGKKTWVAYIGGPASRGDLPPLRPGVLSPLDATRVAPPNENARRRLDFLYAKDYNVWRDLEIIGRGFRQMGRP
jgi:GT2 family glycosyltransferase